MSKKKSVTEPKVVEELVVVEGKGVIEAIAEDPIARGKRLAEENSK